MIYFDNNATTQVEPEVFEAIKPYLGDVYGNPSSAHAAGRIARKAVDEARENIAALAGASFPDEIVFTSSGTESDNWAIRGALEIFPERRHIVTTQVEHEAVRNLCRQLGDRGYSVTSLEVDSRGAIDLDQLREAINENTAVVSVMLANNETGILFPVDDVAKIVKERSDALVHVDAVNAAGKIPINVKSTAIDLLSISGHKFHAPKGIGALYIKRGVTLRPLMIGGGQEQGRRAGTEALHQIVGIGKAAELVRQLAPMERVRALRDRLENEILNRIPNSRINGTRDPALRLPNTSSISFENTNGEAILARLDELGVCVSTGSACASGDHTASPVLEAMKVPYIRAMGAIRFSLGRYNTADEVEFVLDVLPKIVASLNAAAAGG